jgi:UDPglucose 6-dehydrogenase
VSKIHFGTESYDILKDADALAICTEWTIFRTPDFDMIKSLLKSPTVFDGRNLYDLEEMKANGFYYNSIGRTIINQ